MMGMRKRAAAFLFMIVMSTMLFGCSGEKNKMDIAINYLSNELLEKADFEDELNMVDGTVIERLYNINNYVTAQVYISSGATAEEIAIFEFDNKEAAEEGLEKALIRLENQKVDFGSYIPKEVKKLDDAVAKQFGKYVIVCVSDSGEAEKIITQYTGK